MKAICVTQIIKCAISKYLLFSPKFSPKRRFFSQLFENSIFWHRKSTSRLDSNEFLYQDHQNRMRNAKVTKRVQSAKIARFITFYIFFPIANFAISYPILMILVSNCTIFGSRSWFPVSKINFTDYISKKWKVRWNTWEKCKYFKIADFMIWLTHIVLIFRV